MRHERNGTDCGTGLPFRMLSCSNRHGRGLARRRDRRKGMEAKAFGRMETMRGRSEGHEARPWNGCWGVVGRGALELFSFEARLRSTQLKSTTCLAAAPVAAWLWSCTAACCWLRFICCGGRNGSSASLPFGSGGVAPRLTGTVELTLATRGSCAQMSYPEHRPRSEV